MTKDDVLNIRIQEVIYAVRAALEEQDVQKSYSWFNTFPKGSCMDASILLGILLEEYGLNGVGYVSAQKGEASHSWLEWDGWIVDITADQFGDQYPRVIIEKVRELHLGYEINCRYTIKQNSAVPDLGFYKALSKVRTTLKTHN